MRGFGGVSSEVVGAVLLAASLGGLTRLRLAVRWTDNSGKPWSEAERMRPTGCMGRLGFVAMYKTALPRTALESWRDFSG
jgi:hypothetical protein